MRFLVDAQLPPALVQFLRDKGHEAAHVFEIGCNSAPDREIWQKGQETNAVIVTKDNDFVLLSAMSATGPQVILIRLGNTRKHTLISRFAAVLPAILTALESGERLIEIR